MANIVGIENMTAAQIRSEIAQGGRFVHYIWCVSIIVMTFRRSSDIYFIPAGKSAISKGLPFTFLTVLLGWWGFPWGPIYSLQCLGRNLAGGYDVTDGIASAIGAQPQQHDEPELSIPQPKIDNAQPAAQSEHHAFAVERKNSGPVIRR